jgi:hypothetical protein
MKTIEANIMRSFAEVRKDIFFLQGELEELKKRLKLNKQKKK